MCIRDRLGLVMTMYADDTGGFLPTVITHNNSPFWRQMFLAGYYQGTDTGAYIRAYKNGHCPKRDYQYGQTSTSWLPDPADLYKNVGYYGFNYGMGANFQKAFTKHKNSLSQKIMVVDAARHYYLYYVWNTNDIYSLYGVYLGARHNGGVNCLYMDGHVEWMKRDFIQNYQYTYFSYD
ncbi:MAG: hypothetical protein N3D17_07515, partial [bacterium]|nr:hypothetical protein [bacterium]